MVAFYLDNDVAVRARSSLIALGYDVVTTRQLSRGTARDHEQLLFAAHRRRILITHNGRDFRLLVEAWRDWSRDWGVWPHHSGVLVVLQRLRLDHVRLADEVHQFVSSPNAAALTDRLYELNHAGWRRLV